MALLFTSKIVLNTGIEVSNAYGRVAAVDQFQGNRVDSIVEVFVSEEAFTNGAQPLAVGFNKTATIPYNRETDGTDILAIAHDSLVEALSQQGITATSTL